VHVDRVLFQILLVGKLLEALAAGEILLALMYPLHVVFQLTRDPEPFSTLAAAQLQHLPRLQ
jgi:hypothetical protein